MAKLKYTKFIDKFIKTKEGTTEIKFKEGTTSEQQEGAMKEMFSEDAVENIKSMIEKDYSPEELKEMNKNAPLSMKIIMLFYYIGFAILVLAILCVLFSVFF